MSTAAHATGVYLATTVGAHVLVVATGIASLAALATAIGALLVAHASGTGLSPVRNAVSQYGISPARSWYRVMTLAMGISGGALAVALARGLHGPGVAAVVALLGTFAACRAVISWFPMDAPGSPRTTTGGVHGLLALVTFVSASIAAIRLSRVLEPTQAWATLAEVSRDLGWAMVACVALLFLSRLAPELRRGFGAIERALYAAIVAWLAVIGVACATGHL